MRVGYRTKEKKIKLQMCIINVSSEFQWFLEQQYMYKLPLAFGNYAYLPIDRLLNRGIRKTEKKKKKEEKRSNNNGSHPQCAYILDL